MSDSRPEHWVKTTLGEIAMWGSGGTPSRSNASYYGGEIPWIKTGELGDKYLKQTEEFLTAAGIENSSAKVFPAGSVAIAMYGATIGKTSILGIDAATNQACAVAKPKSGVLDSEFLYYLLRSLKDEFVAAGQGGAQPNISQTVLKGWPIRLPPFEEQKRIADKLDRLLAAIDTCKARLDAIPAILKRFRQSVLAAATSGELTKEWRTDAEVVENWKPVTVADIAAHVFDGPFGSNLKSSDYTSSGTRVVRLENIGSLRFDHSKQTFISNKKAESLIGRHELFAGDVLFSSFVDEETRVCLFPQQARDSKSINKADVFCVRVDQSQCDPRFIALRLAARSTYTHLRAQVHGATRPRINLTQLKQLPFRLPSLPEQIAIVEIATLLLAHADKCAARLAMQRARLGELESAVLAGAFAGRRVPQLTADVRSGSDLEAPVARSEARHHSIVAKVRRPRISPRAGLRLTRAEVSGASHASAAHSSKVRNREEVQANHLAAIMVASAGGEALTARELWIASELSIDDFYSQLHRELLAEELEVVGDEVRLSSRRS